MIRQITPTNDHTHKMTTPLTNNGEERRLPHSIFAGEDVGEVIADHKQSHSGATEVEHGDGDQVDVGEHVKAITLHGHASVDAIEEETVEGKGWVQHVHREWSLVLWQYLSREIHTTTIVTSVSTKYGVILFIGKSIYEGS